MRRLVIDASARVPMLRRPQLALQLAAFDACAPTLFRWEVGNTIHGRLAKEFGNAAARKATVAALLEGVRLMDQAGREEAIADVVAKTALTFYDAAYLQLAIDEQALLLTEDRRLHEKARGLLGAGRVWSLDEAETGRVGSP